MIDKNWEFDTITKDDEVNDIKHVVVKLNEPKSYMDSSVHTLESIDLKLDGFNAALTSIINKIQWWETLRGHIVTEAEKVKLKEPDAIPE